MSWRLIRKTCNVNTVIVMFFKLDLHKKLACAYNYENLPRSIENTARYLEDAVLFPIVTPTFGHYIELRLHEEIFNEAAKRARCSVICPSLISHVPHVIPRSSSKGTDVTSFAPRYTWITYETRSLSTRSNYVPIAYVGRSNHQTLAICSNIVNSFLLIS